MGNKGYLNHAINISVILLSTVIFILDYEDIRGGFYNQNCLSVLIVMITVSLVHMVKAGRLYLALYESGLEFTTYLKIYCKVTPVSVVLPWKLGEFFRMYCYGTALGNGLKGMVIIILDRFMDTAALVTAVLLVRTLNGGTITSLVYMLLVFLLFVFLCYLAFPGLYKFWKRNLLREKATNNKLRVLKFLDSLNKIYREIESVAKGRGAILYFLSLIAWGVEIGSITLLNKLDKDIGLSSTISDYLTSALSGGQSNELGQFVFISILFMISIYLVLKAKDTLWKEG